jgi:hypothetical protein
LKTIPVEQLRFGPLPPNCTRVNGHIIARDDDRSPPVYHLFTEGVGWWGFDLKTHEEAERTCKAVGGGRSS